jgi:hypothetical protein
MKKVMLESLEIADLRKFREIFRYHLNNGDNCTGWWQFVPKDFWAPIRRRLQDMRDPSTQLNKYTVAAAAGWRDIGVIQCLDDLINAIALPAVAGLPLTTALGVLPFEDKLLDVHYYAVGDGVREVVVEGGPVLCCVGPAVCAEVVLAVESG